MSPEKPPRPAFGLWKRALIACVALVFLAGATTAAAVLLEVKDVTDEINIYGHGIKVPRGLVTRAEAGSPQTLLVIGSDRRYAARHDKRNARSDTIMLVRLNPDAQATTLMSIPRDLEVHLKAGAPPDKINAAYSLGGPAATARIVKRVLSSPGHPFAINHIVNVNFSGFREAVDKLGCVFTDVDRFYFNDNNPPAGGGDPYAVINIKPGYQKLCGQRALDYVRFRHLDTDIVRSARQQDFLRSAKAQYGPGKLFSNRRTLARLVGKYTQTDSELHSTTGILKILDLVVFSGRKPIQTIHFPAILGDATDPFVHDRPSQVHAAVRRFLAARGAPAKPKPKPRHHRRHKRRRHHAPAGPPPGMIDATSLGEQEGTVVAGKLHFPVFYPRYVPATVRYEGPLAGAVTYPRAYHIKTAHGKYGAYRLVLSAPGFGSYLGVQGMNWRDPPILRSPSEVRRVRGRKLLLFFDGHKLRFVGWKTPRASYYIANTLEESIPNRFLLAMAASLARVGSHR